MTMDTLPSNAWSTLLLPGKVFPASSLEEALCTYERLSDEERTRVELLVRHPQVGGPLKRAAIENLLTCFAAPVEASRILPAADPITKRAASRPASRKRQRGRDRLDPFRQLLGAAGDA